MRKLTMKELSRLSVEEFKSATKMPVIVVLDNIRSQNNIGSIFRTADAFRIESLYLCGITATPPHREIHKTALGATDSVDWKYFASTLEAINDLKNKKYTILAVEQTRNGTKLPLFTPASGKKYALVFGNEVNGIDQEVIDEVEESIEIPQKGTKHSLNVSVSAGIVIWDFFLKLGFYNQKT